MTAPQPATPGSDGEVCACGHELRHHGYGGSCLVRKYFLGPPADNCWAFRPAAPSEPPAADSPTPGTPPPCAACGYQHNPLGWCKANVCADCGLGQHAGPDHYDGCPAAPSPVDTTEPGVAVCFCRDGVIPHEPGSEGCRDTTEPPAETQQDDSCSTPGCTGDPRYAAPGRGHVQGCRHPFSLSAETQQDDEIIRAILDRGIPAHAAPFVDFDVIVRELRALAARPFADTETLRETLAQLERLAGDECGPLRMVVLDAVESIRAALGDTQ